MNKISLTLFAIVLFFNTIHAQSAFLDPSFGTGGIVRPSGLGGYANMLVQPDGKILIREAHILNPPNPTLGLWIHRMLPDGSFDPDFGTGGSVLIGTFRYATARSNDMELLADGKILTGLFNFSSGNDSLLTYIFKFNADGSPDTTFGNNGQVTILEDNPVIGDNPFLHDIEIQSNGRIVLVYHSSYSLYTNYGFRLLQPNGAILFGYTEVNWGYVGDMDEHFTQALIQPDDKILVGGYRDPLSGPSIGQDFLLERFESSTFSDDNFGVGGYAIADNNNQEDRMYDLLLEPDGKILTCGSSQAFSLMIAKFLDNGAPDLSFGTNGKIVYPNLLQTEFGSSISRGSDGSFVISGWKHPLTVNNEAAVVRFLANGDIDTTFSPDGLVYLPFAETGFYGDLYDIVVLPDRRILACGDDNTTSNNLLLVRFLPEANARVWYRDLDGDGYGTDGYDLYAASAPSGYAALNGDCNDNDFFVNPGVAEICGNNTDENCDGFIGADSLPPVAICLPTVKFNLNAAGLVTIQSIELDNGSYDDCGGIAGYWASDTVFDCSNLGVQMVTLTVTDLVGNNSTCQVVVKIADQLEPTMVCLPNVNLLLDFTGSATLSPGDLDAGSFDNCVAIEQYWISQTDFNCDNLGMQLVTLTVVDLSSNINSCQANVNVLDVTPPTPICPEIMVLELDDTGLLNLSPAMFDQGSFDACGIESLDVFPAQLTTINLGENTITLIITDHSGNIGNCSTTVTLIEKTSATGVLQDESMLNLTPNPSTGICSLRMGEGLFYESVEVLNATGQLILEEKIGANYLQIDFSDQVSGCYYFRVQSEGKVQVLKLMLIR
jgi:uncharacterized delta-60 repeat protein